MRSDTIDYVNQLQQPVADQSPTNLELLNPLFTPIICIFQDQMYITFCMAALFGCRWLLMLHRKPLADQILLGDHQQTIDADHCEEALPYVKRVVVGGRRES